MLKLIFSYLLYLLSVLIKELNIPLSFHEQNYRGFKVKALYNLSNMLHHSHVFMCPDTVMLRDDFKRKCYK